MAVLSFFLQFSEIDSVVVVGLFPCGILVDSGRSQTHIEIEHRLQIRAFPPPSFVGLVFGLGLGDFVPFLLLAVFVPQTLGLEGGIGGFVPLLGVQRTFAHPQAQLVPDLQCEVGEVCPVEDGREEHLGLQVQSDSFEDGRPRTAQVRLGLLRVVGAHAKVPQFDGAGIFVQRPQQR